MKSVEEYREDTPQNKDLGSDSKHSAESKHILPVSNTSSPEYYKAQSKFASYGSLVSNAMARVCEMCKPADGVNQLGLKTGERLDQRTDAKGDENSWSSFFKRGQDYLKEYLNPVSEIASRVLDSSKISHKNLRKLATYGRVALMTMAMVSGVDAASVGSDTALLRRSVVPRSNNGTSAGVLGDSVAFGFNLYGKPSTGYDVDLAKNLTQWGITKIEDKAIVGETTTTFLEGGAGFLPKNVSEANLTQIEAALQFLKNNNVELITLQIGANNILPAINYDATSGTCEISPDKFNQGMEAISTDLPKILTMLRSGINGSGDGKGDLLMINYYNPFQQVCPETERYLQQFNDLLNTTAGGNVTKVVDISHLFTNETIGNYTEIYAKPVWDVHPTNLGYQVIANEIARQYGEIIENRNNQNNQSDQNSQGGQNNQTDQNNQNGQNSQNSQEGKGKLIGGIVGGVLGGLLLIGGPFAIFMCMRKRGNQAPDQNTVMELHEE